MSSYLFIAEIIKLLLADSVCLRCDVVVDEHPATLESLIGREATTYSRGER